MRPLYLLCLVILAAGCSQRMYIPSGYSPEQPDAVLGLVETEQADVLMENVEVNGKHLVFDLEVYNKSDFPVVIDARNFYYYGGVKEFDPLAPGEEVNASFGQAAPDARGIFALNEKKVNHDIRATIRSRQAAAIILAVAATAIVVNDIVQDSKDIRKEVWTRNDASRSNARDVATIAGLFTIDMVRQGMEMQQQKEFADLEYLPEEFLHRTLLKGGERIRGKVFFPVREVEHLRLVLPIDRVDYIFDFRRATNKEMRLIKGMTGSKRPPN